MPSKEPCRPAPKKNLWRIGLGDLETIGKCTRDPEENGASFWSFSTEPMWKKEYLSPIIGSVENGMYPRLASLSAGWYSTEPWCWEEGYMATKWLRSSMGESDSPQISHDFPKNIDLQLKMLCNIYIWRYDTKVGCCPCAPQHSTIEVNRGHEKYVFHSRRTVKSQVPTKNSKAKLGPGQRNDQMRLAEMCLTIPLWRTHHPPSRNSWGEEPLKITGVITCKQ